jgi:hypothetical protein
LLILIAIGELRATRAIKRYNAFGKHLRYGWIGLAIRFEDFDHLQVA